MVVQVALSLVLLAAAGLFLSTFRRLATLPLGFEAARILVVDVDTARAHSDPASRTGYYQQIVETVASLPGVARGRLDDHPVQSGEVPLFADVNRVHEHVVSPGFFATYAVPLRTGRDFDGRTRPAVRVAIVSESYVAKFLRAGTLWTRHSTPEHAAPAWPVCRRRRRGDAVFGPLRSGPRPTIYFPLAQSADLGPPNRDDCDQRATAAVRPAVLAATVADALTKMNGRMSFSTGRSSRMSPRP